MTLLSRSLFKCQTGGAQCSPINNWSAMLINGGYQQREAVKHKAVKRKVKHQHIINYNFTVIKPIALTKETFYLTFPLLKGEREDYKHISHTWEFSRAALLEQQGGACSLLQFLAAADEKEESCCDSLSTWQVSC